MVTPTASIELSGVGIHTGASASVQITPAEPGAGVSLYVKTTRIPVSVKSVVSTRRCTVLGNGSVTCSTVEHLFSALNGLRVTDVRIDVNGPEIPILDGSSLPWVEALVAAKLKPVEHPLSPAGLMNPVVTRQGDSWYTAVPSDGLKLTCVSSFHHPMLGTDIATFDERRDEYADSVAPARTFGFAEEVAALQQSGLALGGTLDNALIVYEDRFSSPLRMPHEWATHKLLDLLGDLLLFGGRIAADIVAIKPSHTGNTHFVNLLVTHAAAAG